MTVLTINQPKIKLHDGIMATTSLNVAKVFNRNHRDVTRKIENLEIPQDFNERNFTRVEYKDAKGEIRKAYEITRDGFTLLAMGFTGKKAMQFKLAYIEAFNTMESELLQKYKQAALPNTITPKQKLSIRDAMAKKVYDNYGKKMIPSGFKAEWHDFYEAFGISKYEELPADRFDDAMGYILGEWIPEEETLAIPDDMMLVSKSLIATMLNECEKSIDNINEMKHVEDMAEEASKKAYFVTFAAEKLSRKNYDSVRSIRKASNEIKRLMN